MYTICIHISIPSGFAMIVHDCECMKGWHHQLRRARIRQYQWERQCLHNVLSYVLSPSLSTRSQWMICYGVTNRSKLSVTNLLRLMVFSIMKSAMPWFIRTMYRFNKVAQGHLQCAPIRLRIRSIGWERHHPPFHFTNSVHYATL